MRYILQFIKIPLCWKLKEAEGSFSHILLHFHETPNKCLNTPPKSWSFWIWGLTYHHCLIRTCWPPYKKSYLFSFLHHLQYFRKFQKLCQIFARQVYPFIWEQDQPGQYNHIPSSWKTNRDSRNFDIQF